MISRRWMRLMAIFLVLTLVTSCRVRLGPRPADTAMTTTTAPTTTAPTVVAATPTTGTPKTPTAVPTAVPRTPTVLPTATIAPLPQSSRPPGFAAYRLEEPTVAPTGKPYTIAPDLSNVAIHRSFGLSTEAKAALVKNSFVVTAGDDKEFFHLYERLTYDQAPAFITTDSVLHVYHLLFDKLLRDTERENLLPALTSLTDAMVVASQAHYDRFKGTSLENAAKRNLAYFAVAARLLNAKAAIPDVVQGPVASELRLIEASAGIAPSPIFGYPEDYSQYVPRGHYSRNDQTKAYFRASMWYGRLTFLADPKRAETLDQTRSALLIVSALSTAASGSALANWQKIFDTTAFFVGVADDLTFYEYRDLVKAVYGSLDQPQVFTDDTRLRSFAQRAYDLQPPAINSSVVSASEDRDAATRGFRFLGQRFVLDAAVFQRLIDREVPGRMLPRSLDIPAAMGSKEALAILEAAGETKYDRYGQQMAGLQKSLAAITQATWTQNLYWSWLYTLQPLLQVRGEGYPNFMRSQAWVRKDLNTFLGSWTELKHDTLLYAKQAYAERGGGPEEIVGGYVEPNADVYARLSALTRMTRQGLADRAMLSKTNGDLLTQLDSLLVWLKSAAERELAGQALNKDDNSRIEAYGALLETFVLAAADPEDPNAGGRKFIENITAAVVADVATNPQGNQVLEEAIGRVFPIYAIVPVGGGLQLAKGGVFAYYEFTVPIANRMTDETWRATLDAGKAPPLPTWTGAYMAAR